MSEQHFSVAAVGDVEHADFASARSALRRTVQLREFAGAAELRADLESGAFLPELIVLMQSRPGQLSQRQVDDLLRCAPLARCVGLLGSWCEGEFRTGTPWVGVERVFWYAWRGWWQRALLAKHEHRCPSWSRPLTADPAEQLTEDAAQSSAATIGCVAVASGDCDSGPTLVDCLRGLGTHAVWCRRPAKLDPTANFAAGIWMGTQLGPDELYAIQEFCHHPGLKSSPVIVVADFPRRVDAQQAMAAGARDVLGKPYLVDDLLSAMRPMPVDDPLRDNVAA